MQARQDGRVGGTSTRTTLLALLCATAACAGSPRAQSTPSPATQPAPVAGEKPVAPLPVPAASVAPTATAVAPEAEGRMPRVLLTTSRGCHGDEPVERVLRTRDAWLAWWKDEGCAAGDAPAVDWNREMVVAAGDRERSNTCWSVTIEGTSDVEGALVVGVVRDRPPADAVCGMMMVHPAAAVAVPRHDDPVRFTWRERIRGAR
jgi:hypothetical protein